MRERGSKSVFKRDKNVRIREREGVKVCAREKKNSSTSLYENFKGTKCKVGHDATLSLSLSLSLYSISLSLSLSLYIYLSIYLSLSLSPPSLANSLFLHRFLNPELCSFSIFFSCATHATARTELGFYTRRKGIIINQGYIVTVFMFFLILEILDK